MTQLTTYPLLIVATNSYETVWYKLTDAKTADELERLRDPKAEMSDNEGLVNQERDHLWNEETRAHLKKCVEKTAELWATGIYSRLVVSAPAEIKNEIQTTLGTISSVAYVYLPGNFTHESLKEKLLQEAEAALHPLA